MPSRESGLERLRSRACGRTVVVGIGNPMRGDDGVGPRVIELLAGRTAAVLLDAGDVPENFAGRIAEHAPDTVVLVDAADLGAEPGAVAVLEADEIGGASFSTHNPSLVPFADFVRKETGATILAVGIQPLAVDFLEGLSPEAEQAARRVADALAAPAE